MSEEQNIVAAPHQPPAPTKAPIMMGDRGLRLASFEDGWRFAQMVVASGFAPKGLEKPESVLIAIQLGLEVGMSPMMALQNIAVINGRPGIFGDAALAMVHASGLLEDYSQTIEGSGDTRCAVVTAKRRGSSTPFVSRFGVQQAKTAGLWGKSGPWSQYPDRMLVFRARGFALRDGFPDVLKGMRTVEELQDTPPAGKQTKEWDAPPIEPFAGKTPENPEPQQPETLDI